MQRSRKFALAFAILAVGGVAAFFFRKEPSQSEPPKAAVGATTPQADPVAPRATTLAIPTSSLTGRIELLDPPADATTSMQGATTTAANPSGGSRQTATAGGTDLVPFVGSQFPSAAAQPSAAGSASFVGMSAPERGYRTHRIVDGDTLVSLADRYLGQAARYLEIFELNRDVLRDPNILPIGTVLKIPRNVGEPTSTIVPTSSAPGTVPGTADEPATADPREWAPLEPLEPSAARPSQNTRAGAQTYRVERRDTLAQIAWRFYGDKNRYKELYEANRDRMRSPDDLREGLLLVIP